MSVLVVPVRTGGVLAPAGAEAAALAEVTVVLIVGAALLAVLTLALIAHSLRRGARPWPVAWWVLGGGIALPLAVLTPLLGYATWRTHTLDRPPPADAPVIGITGAMWWWEIRYRDPASGREVVSANELRLPVGRTVRLGLTSRDVIHSFWVPSLGGKRDTVPGRVNHLVVTAGEPGTWHGACAEYCGEQHARMGLLVTAMPADEFDRWLAAQAAPAATPADTRLERGRAAFLDNGCAVCHSVRGVADDGRRGPDLTHVGSRLFLGAGTLRNDGAASIASWLAGVQALKPGAHMPSIRHLDAATLDALAGWLAALR